MLKKLHSIKDLQTPVNDNDPVRIAFLGGAKSGKSSIISKLVYGTFGETYYPTNRINPILHDFTPKDYLSRVILEEGNELTTVKKIVEVPNLLLSPVLYHRPPPQAQNEQHIGEDITVVSSNNFYKSYRHRYESNEDSSEYVPPHVTPILVELIDTPKFNPNEILPFLEASIYHRLGKDVLHNLADEPRMPVSAHPLLVASGASEMNANVDGYFFVYSSVPSYNPPAYNEVLGSDPATPKDKQVDASLGESVGSCGLPAGVSGDAFDLLAIMKLALDEAWQEYNSYKTKWEKGQEGDIFSIKSALKNLWVDQSTLNLQKLRAELNSENKLTANPVDPSDVNCPPPIWIVCTNAESSLSSPRYIENGMKLAKFWNCGFIAIDSTKDDNACLSLMIREIVVRKKLQGKKKR